jgi:phage terminase small subunit
MGFDAFFSPATSGFLITRMADELTPKQQRFVEEYLVDLNGKQAAIRAGYSEKAAEQQASRLLTYAKVALSIAEGRKTIAERLGITHEKVLKEYARLAFLDIRKAFDEEGRLLPIHDIDDDTAAAIAGLEVEHTTAAVEVEEEMEGQPHGGALKRNRGREVVGQIAKLKLSDKKAALDSLAKHLGLLSDQAQNNLTLNLAGQVTVYLPDNGRDKRD